MTLARLGLVILFVLAGRIAAAGDIAAIEVFTRAGCPHCADARAFLTELGRERPGLHIVWREVDRDPAALRELERLSREAGAEAPGVPTFRIGEALVIGFESPHTTGARIRALVESGRVAGQAASSDAIDTGLFGTLRASELGLPAFTVALGLVDGLNPCAMWVLMFLLSLLVNLRDRSRMAVIAGTFVIASGLVYFAFMAAWLNVFLLIGLSREVQIALGLVALAIGVLNVKDFFAFGRGPSLSIPAGAKPGIYARARAILRERSTLASLTGVAALALLVNTVELLCTAGLPAVYTAILARTSLSSAEHYAYLALYNLAYVADDALMVTVAVVTLSKAKLGERAGRVLKLTSGAVMLALALGLLFFPGVLV
ncbi:MAG: glutaredoxin family protein [Myxococcota bacterium]